MGYQSMSCRGSSPPARPPNAKYRHSCPDVAHRAPGHALHAESLPRLALPRLASRRQTPSTASRQVFRDKS